MKKIFHYLKPYAVLSVISPLLMAGEVGADLILPYLMSFIVNYGIMGIDIKDPRDGSAVALSIMRFFHPGVWSGMDLILTFGILMLVITAVGGFFGVSCAVTAAHAAQGFGKDLRCDAYRRVMSLSIEQTDSFTTGSLITRMTNDITQVMDFIETMLRGFIRSPMFIIGGICMLTSLNLKFGFVLLCATPVMVITLVIVIKKAIPQYSVVQKWLDSVNTVVQENINGARVVKAYVREDYECGRFDLSSSSLKESNFRVLKQLAIISPVLTIVLNLSIAALIYIGGFEIAIERSGMTTGSIMAAITYVTQIMTSVLMITNLLQSISRAQVSAKRITEVLETKPVIYCDLEQKPESTSSIASDSRTDQSVGMEITFQNVSFSYPDAADKPVLKNINLNIRSGETLAIIGATGSGKSSLAALIPRFYDVTAGNILINGISIRHYDLNDLRKNIGYVMQKSELVSDSILENIRWGKPDASDEEIRKAAETAQALHFITNTENGFQTILSERGASLSGGQKQRISIARALVRNPSLLILDDATSALDLATESAFRSSLKKSLRNTTVLMIAQRIASIMNADRIAVLENDGTIQYCAPHDELLKCCETYREIYDSQIKSGAIV